MPERADLRRHLDEAGLTFEATAAAVRRMADANGKPLRTSRSTVGQWVRGYSPPNTDVTGYLCDLLTVRLGRRVAPADVGLAGPSNDDVMSSDPVDGIAALTRADVTRRGVLAGAAYSLAALALPLDEVVNAQVRAGRNGARIGLAEVAAVRQITDAHNDVDERLGGGFGRTALAEFLGTDVAAYCRATATADVRAKMLGAAAQLAYLGGWKSHDVGVEGPAQRYYLYGYRLALASGDTAQAGQFLHILAHQAYDLGEHVNCVRLAEAAVAHTAGRTDAHTAALVTLTLAKAHAMAGDRHAAYAALAAAERQMNAARDSDERPWWAGFHGLNLTQWHNHNAKTLVELRDYGPAVDHFTASTRIIDPATRPRLAALTGMWLGETEAARGHLDSAADTFGRALALMGGIQSNRTRQAIHKMGGALAPFRRRNAAGVETLLARGRAVLATSA